MITYATWLKANKEHLDYFIINEAYDWIDQLQTQFGADKPLTSQYSLLGTKDWTSLGKAKNTANKDQVTYRTLWKHDKHNVNHVTVQFNCFQGGGDIQTFRSSEALYLAFERDNTLLPTYDPLTVLSGIKDKHERKAKIADAENNKRRKQELNKAKAVKYFVNEVYPSLSEKGESAYFSETKGMPNEFWQGQGLRFGNDANLKHIDRKNSDFAAVRLISALNDEPIGLELIYPDGTKKLTYGTDKSRVPCALFGADIETATTMLFFEGLADGFINLMAYQEILPEKVTGVFAVDAENLGRVVDAFSKRYQSKKGLIICDNDKWKYDHADNTGVLKGTEAAIKAGYPYVIPNFAGNVDSKPTDISDLYRLGGLPAVVNQLRQQIVPPTRYDWSIQQINYIGLRANKDAFSQFFIKVKSACHRSSERIPLESQDKVLQTILNVIDNQVPRLSSCHNFKQLEIDRLKEYAIQQLNNNLSKAVENSTPLSLEKAYLLKEQGVNVIRYDLTLTNGKYRINQEVAQRIIEADSGLHILNAQKDTGKTFSVIRPCIRKSIYSEVEYPTVITHLVSLTSDVGEKCEIDNYQDINNTDDVIGLAITVNSIINPKFSRYLEASQLIVIDEIDAVFEAIETGTVKAEDREKTYKALLKLLGKRKVIVTGADIDNECLDKLRKARDTSEITLYIANSAPVLQGLRAVNYGSDESVLLVDFMESVSNKINLCLASDNIKLIEAQNEELVKKGVKTLCITSNNGETKAAKEFFQNPNEYIRKHRPQALLYTPKLCSGLSIDIDHFKIAYGVYRQQVPVKGFQQMIARSRPTMEYRLAFPSRKRPGELFEKAQERLGNEVQAAYHQNNRLLEESDELIEIGDGKLSIPISPFTEQRLRAIADEPYQRDPNDILLRLMAEGATIEYASPVTDEKKEESDSENKRIKAEYKQLVVDRLIAAGNSLDKLTPDELTRITQDALLKKEKGQHIDTIHEAALIKHNYYRTTPFDEEFIEFHLKDGWKKCLFFEDYLTNSNTIKQFDRIESLALNKDISQLKNNTLRHYFSDQFMKELGITVYEIGKMDCPVDEINNRSESVQRIIALITKHQDAFNGCMRGTGVEKFTDRTARQPMKFIRSWLKLFGFKSNPLPTERLGVKVIRNYTIDYSEFHAFIVPYLIGREGQGKNHLTKKTREYEEYIGKQLMAAEPTITQPPVDRISKEIERQAREAAKRAQKAEREAIRRNGITGNAMPGARNSSKPTPTTVDEPSTLGGYRNYWDDFVEKQNRHEAEMDIVTP